MNILWLLILLCCCSGCQDDGCGRDSDPCGERRDRDDRGERSGCGCGRQEAREERSGCDSARPEPRQPFGNACMCEQ